MKVEIRAPSLAESVATGTLLAWRKQAGERVVSDETVADVETDKVILEISAPASGTLADFMLAEGAEVRAGQVMAYVDTETETPTVEPGVRAADAVPAGDVPSAGESLHHPGPLPLTGEGEGAPLPAPPQIPRPLQGERTERREPLSRLRLRVAERLLAAQREAAILTTFNEVNLAAVNELRQRYQAEFQTRHGIKLGYMSFFVRAACLALDAYPVANARIEGTEVVHPGYKDIGIAVSTPRGLVVPILRDADRLSFAETEQGIAELAARARDGRLGLEELAGGTFSITNGGVFGSLLSTPILNPPQSAILGMHKIQERPVAEMGQVVIRPMMYLALSYDHRLIDGREAVQFLVAVKEALERPERLLLGV